MQTTVEVLNGLERKIHIKTPVERIEQEVEKQLKQVATKIKIAGFRPGKAPLELIRSQVGPGVRAEVLEKVINSTYQQAISQEKLIPASRPTIELITNEDNKPLEYTVTLEVYPDIPAANLSSLSLEKPDVSVTEQDIDDMLQKLRAQASDWENVDRACQKGDRIIVSFEGKIDSVLFKGSSAEKATLDLGAGKTLPEFEEGLLNHRAGENVQINVTFPAGFEKRFLAERSKVAPFVVCADLLCRLFARQLNPQKIYPKDFKLLARRPRR